MNVFIGISSVVLALGLMIWMLYKEKYDFESKQ